MIGDLSRELSPFAGCARIPRRGGRFVVAQPTLWDYAVHCDLDALPAFDTAAFVSTEEPSALKRTNDFCPDCRVGQEQRSDRAAGVEPRDNVGHDSGSGSSLGTEGVSPCPPLFWLPVC